MKKRVFLAACCLVIETAALAHGGGCCTMSGNFIGILPQFHKNYVGIRYAVRSYTMPAMYMDHGTGPMLHSPESTDKFTTTELWARLYPTRKLQVVATLPYVHNQTTAGFTSVNSSGIGDALVLANYALVTTPDSALCTVKHRLQAGGGIKLPTGRHEYKKEPELTVPANFTPGTGTIDYMLSAQYTVKMNQLGLTNDLIARFNSQKKTGYKFGNQLTFSSQLFYWLKVKQFSVLPAAGIYLEKSEADTNSGTDLPLTKGTTYFGNLGLDVYFKQFALGATWQSPFLRQETENGMIKNDRASAHFTVMF